MEDVHKTYYLGKTAVPAIKGVSCETAEGEFVCFMGPSGSGKSTLLNIIGCLDRPDRGRVAIEGIEVTELDRNRLADLRAHTIGYVFQAFNLISVLSVYENVELPLFIKNERLAAAEQKERIMRLIREVGLEDQIRHRPDELSGGAAAAGRHCTGAGHQTAHRARR